VAPSPWHVQIWLVDDGCTFYDQAPTTIPNTPTPVRVPLVDTEESIAAEQLFSSNGPHGARPLIRSQLIVKTHDGGQLFQDWSTALRLLTSCLKTLKDVLLCILVSL
jgi:hypothetical protein